ncbi:lipase member H-like, partial [Homalodisca vitripennis]|uniref:lipase member H-like n=1 Tax=Homalodisca vitripennis TaxID=197043 RepID=UPI001EEA6DC8
MIYKMAALLCAFFIFDISYKRIPNCGIGNATKCRNRRLPRSLRNFNPELDVHFYLFTKYNPYEAHEIFPEKPSTLFISHFDFNKTTKILIHGWKNTGNSTFSLTLRNAYIAHMSVNVIIVDWHKLSHHSYRQSRRFMDLVAVRIAQLYDFLRQYVARETIHVIGHSLGAHVAGIVGEIVKMGKIYRITGLDPAGPLINKHVTNGRLDKLDAQFVDVIHTSGFALGFYSPLGHADFYPNRGVPIQPGCGVDVVGKCSHRRSYHLFKESISRQSQFMAAPCPSWRQFRQHKCYSQWHRMGEHVEYGIEGKFYLQTGDTPPYGLVVPEERLLRLQLKLSRDSYE